MIIISFWAYHVDSKPWKKSSTPLKLLVPLCLSPDPGCLSSMLMEIFNLGVVQLAFVWIISRVFLQFVFIFLFHSTPLPSLFLFCHHTWLGNVHQPMKLASQVYLSSSDSAFYWSRDPHSRSNCKHTAAHRCLTGQWEAHSRWAIKIKQREFTKIQNPKKGRFHILTGR